MLVLVVFNFPESEKKMFCLRNRPVRYLLTSNLPYIIDEACSSVLSYIIDEACSSVLSLLTASVSSASWSCTDSELALASLAAC